MRNTPKGETLKRLFVAFTFVGLAALPAFALTPEQVKSALQSKKGISYDVKTSFSWKKNSFGGEHVAFISTPYSRLTWLAQSAREKFEEVSEEEVAKAVENTQVCVSSGTSDAKVQSIVLVPKSIDKPTPADVIKPGELSVDMVDMYNKMGGQWKEANYTACFLGDLDFQNLDVIVVYQGGNKNNFRGHFPKELK
jgi:hypothetical protein